MAAVASVNEVRWYAVHTRARHEKRVADRLQEQGLSAYLPLVKETHRWSDRKKVVEMPLFSCYVFVRMAPGGKQRLRVCSTDGVLQIVGPRGAEIPIPDEQIEAVRLLLAEQLPCSVHPSSRSDSGCGFAAGPWMASKAFCWPAMEIALWLCRWT